MGKSSGFLLIDSAAIKAPIIWRQLASQNLIGSQGLNLFDGKAGEF
jgi:hypothetical protein